ncbi:response regulator [Limnoraphis robusta]|uniref:histidine kinase n=1 Tax=Limnoraphis robusta CCNP1315 TaxID=3110306 RepID=A0ABU5TWA1_9CYAN|nr:response regulator [Limnoraphis robusta]MEA5519176.1 response regulator [Limnoraphis robusta CCNP1315]MEA5546984.1 response regulator [Limnoraphis robusta CCNP1324]
MHALWNTLSVKVPSPAPMLQILLLEDDPVDVELIQTTLKSGGIEANLICVTRRSDFSEILKTQLPDLILSDYVLPSFDGIAALKIAQEFCPQVPFIMVSGMLGEERAIETLKQGATDYVLKQRLERLVPSAKRALRESQERLERLRVEETLRQTDDLLRAIVDASPVGIITLNPQKKVIAWNIASERIYGWQSQEVINQALPVIPPEEQNQFDRLFQQALQNHTLTNYEFQHLGKNKDLIEISVSLAPLHNAQGNVCGVVMTAIDITTRKRIEAERFNLLKREQTARAEAEAANRVKDEFLAVLSHELRTPLNSILGWITLIQRGKLNKVTFDQALEVIERNASLQTQLIEDLLDISRISRGKLSLSIDSVNLIELMQTTAETLRPAADAKSISMELFLDSSVGIITGDANRLQQIFWNLFSNAIKFTPPNGSVTVRLKKTEDSYAKIQVIDSGIGIEPNFLPYVFEYFRQADASTTRSQGGLGLGLAISRHLVELHGGTIDVESQGKGKGTTFTVMLPIQVMQSDGDQPDKLIDNGLSLQDVKIMVVEDQADARELIRLILEQQGAQVIEASSSKQALEIIKESIPDVLISDIGMPDEDGYSFLKKVRSLPQDQGGNIPALALTAYTKEEDRQQAIAAGFQMHLGKPLDITELVQAVFQLSPKTA